MLTELTQLFKQYLALSEERRPGFIASLGDGRELAELEQVFSETPDLFRAIYTSVSGTGSDVEEAHLIEFIPGYRLIHLAEMKEAMEGLNALLAEKNQQAAGVILPLLTHYGGDFICYHRAPDGAERICDMLRDYGDLTVMYNSPKLFLETLCEFYRQGVYFLDEEGYLDCDLIQEGEVGAERNPGAPYWAE